MWDTGNVKAFIWHTWHNNIVLTLVFINIHAYTHSTYLQDYTFQILTAWLGPVLAVLDTHFSSEACWGLHTIQKILNI